MNIENKRRELRTILAEVTRTRDAFRGKSMPRVVGEEWSKQITKAEKLQAEIKEWESEIPFTPLPAARVGQRSEMSTKTVNTPGAAFTESDVYTMLKGDNWPRSSSPKVLVPSFGTKAIPTFSSSNASTFSVIEAGRDPEIVRSYEFERLRLRDVITVSTTGSDTVQFVKVTSDKPDSATGVAPTVAKPESDMALEVSSVPVRTLAVHMPVTEQQLEDVSQIRGLIDTELKFDIDRLEEYQVVWGDGTIFLGIMETPGVAAFTRTPDVGAGVTVTLLDEIRGAVSDILVNGHQPDAVALHPYDMEALSVSKGTDDHYLAQVYPTQGTGLRLWSLQVIETLAMEAYRSGLSQNQRVVLVGDYKRGATLWDRNRTSVEVGYVDKQFIENVRTIRAETREAFAVKRPTAFRYITTVAAGT